MRVLVIDQDSALLTAITRLLGEYFTIDAVTTKADCQDLVRYNEYDVIVAGERLEDGSGLELLSQMAGSRPDMLRIFAAEPGRLKLLKGRLGPFGLFRTLSYPIEPRQLLAALSAAAGFEEDTDEAVEEASEESEESEEFEAEFHGPPEPASPARALPRPAVPVPTPAAAAPMRPVPQLQTPTRVSAVVTAAVLGNTARSTTSATATAAAPASALAATDGAGRRSRSSPRAPGQTSITDRSGRNAGHGGAGNSQLHRSRQPTPEALALGARLAGVSRTKAKSFAPPSLAASAQRSAFAVGAGVALIVGALILAFRMFSPPALHTANLANTQPPTYPPEVLKLVADTETAFQLDDLKGAHTDIVALQQIAPTHPGLPFFEAELKRRQAEAAAAKSERSRPQVVSPSGPASPTRKPASRGTTFSGTTLEDTSTGNH